MVHNHWNQSTNSKLEELAALTSFVMLPEHEMQYDWAPVESSLGFSFPSEFNAYTQRFSPGAHREQLYVFHAAMPGNYGLEHSIRDYAKGFQEWADLDAASPRPGVVNTPYSIYPAPGGLIPWAAFQNYGALCWLPEVEDPDQWPVIAYSDSWGDTRIEGTTLEALARVVRGDAGHGVFPDYMYEEPIEFRPWDPMEFGRGR
jgi:hypothetical protein